MHSTLRDGYNPAAARKPVEVMPLTELLALDTDVALVKIDVEGYEGEVLEGMRSLLVQRRIRAIMLEAEPDYGALDWVAALCAQPGYRVFELVLDRRLLRWRPRLAPIEPSYPGRGTLFVLEDGTGQGAGH
jgi:hypothetical protein